jgi:dihydroneopterin aldolase
MMSRTTEITLRAMRFQALVGILPHERTTPQPVEIDLTVTVTEGEGVVDYRRLYDVTAAVIGEGHIEFLEDIAEQVATGALESSDRVARARVAVRKPHVALGGPLTYAEVRIDRRSPSSSG